jgi:hypothetical protein
MCWVVARPASTVSPGQRYTDYRIPYELPKHQYAKRYTDRTSSQRISTPNATPTVRAPIVGDATGCRRLRWSVMPPSPSLSSSQRISATDSHTELPKDQCNRFPYRRTDIAKESGRTRRRGGEPRQRSGNRERRDRTDVYVLNKWPWQFGRGKPSMVD